MADFLTNRGGSPPVLSPLVRQWSSRHSRIGIYQRSWSRFRRSCIIAHLYTYFLCSRGLIFHLALKNCRLWSQPDLTKLNVNRYNLFTPHAAPTSDTITSQKQVTMHSHPTEVIMNMTVALWTIATLITCSKGTICRCSDSKAACWPAQEEWNAFNVTIGGRLIAPKPTGNPNKHQCFCVVRTCACKIAPWSLYRVIHDWYGYDLVLQYRVHVAAWF